MFPFVVILSFYTARFVVINIIITIVAAVEMMSNIILHRGNNDNYDNYDDNDYHNIDDIMIVMIMIVLR